jgi:anti-sigma factor RsiW
MTHIHSASCHALKEQLSGFIDGELDDAVCAEIQRHLDSCEDCRIMVDTLKKTVVLYRESPPEAVPPDVHERLIKVLDLEELIKRKK